MTRSLDDALADIAHVMFPGDDVPRRIAPDTRAADGDTPLHVFAWRGDDAAVSLLLAAGADPDAIGDMGETPLHVAIRQTQPHIVRALLQAGARTDLVSGFEETPRQMAKRAGGVVWATFREARRR